MMADDVKVKHVATFRSKILGGKAIGRGNHYGTDVRCSCGWARQTNEDRKYVRRIWRLHVEESRESEAAK